MPKRRERQREQCFSIMLLLLIHCDIDFDELEIHLLNSRGRERDRRRANIALEWANKSSENVVSAERTYFSQLNSHNFCYGSRVLNRRYFNMVGWEKGRRWVRNQFNFNFFLKFDSKFRSEKKIKYHLRGTGSFTVLRSRITELQQEKNNLTTTDYHKSRAVAWGQ